MRLLCLIFILFQYFNAHSQGRNANWVFGDSAGMDFNGLYVPTTFHSNCKSKGETSGISETLGNLLFYTYGFANIPLPDSKIYDNDFAVMWNGDSIIADEWFNTDIIIPSPLQDSIYFHFACIPEGVLYSVIQKNGALSQGLVLTKNNVLLENTMSDCLQAVTHGNGRDWWIITRLGGVIPNDTFFVWLVDPNGISGPFSQKAGISALDGFHHISFNSDGSQFFEVSASGITRRG